MSTETIIAIIIAGLAVLGGLVGLIVALVRGDMKKDVIAWMEEAEASGKDGPEKLKYVIEKFKEKYKIAQFLLNLEKFVKLIIDVTKKINYKE